MDNSQPENGQTTPELSPADISPPERRSIRRRLVQSTLFSPKLQPQDREENGHGKAERDRVDEKDDNGGGEDEDCGGSQGKRKRKPRAKTTPQKKSSEKSKGKRSCNTTPRKNLANLLNEEAPIAMPDLRQEAKISAEENSRMFSGRQIHPFFSSCKSNKKNREIIDLEGQQFATGRTKKETNCAPIHVFEKTQDSAVPLDWKTWKFHEGIFTESNLFLETACSSIAGCSVACLSFDKFPITLRPCDTSITGVEVPLQQCPIQEECAYETTPMVEDDTKFCYQPLKDAEDKKVNAVDSFTWHTGRVQKAPIGQESRFLEERMKSYYLCCSSQPNDSLWTYKYQPKKAMEVCGNDESVKFLSEWLQHWRGRDLQISRDNDCDVDGGEDKDYICSESDSDTENKQEEGGLKNVLLVTGPVGSGKSAAIYACAREQGYKVLEVSASECRNGALVKQRFGEALESQQLKRSLANPVCSPNKHIVKPSAFSNGAASQDSDGAVVELITLSDDDCHDATAGSGFSNCKEAAESCCHESEVKALILFEDVDVNFLEDRGFIAAIQQISETAKGPIILTSNSHDPLLPENLDRMQLCFVLPSSEDLLSHVHMVCMAEGIDVQPCLLEQLRGFCDGDIRKLIMHLQFWCQGKSTRKARKIQRECGSLLFDLEAGHRILPKLIPWDLPSQLSELVDKEVTQSLYRQDSSLMEVIEEELHSQETHHAFMHDNETKTIEAKKTAMLSLNFSVNEYDEFKAELDTEVSDNSDTPFSCFRRNSRKQHETVLSSDSEDELADNGCIICPDRDANDETPFEESQTLKELQCFPGLDEKHYHCPETESFIPVAEECKSLDVSCVPESSFVPETVISNGAELGFRTISGNYVDEEVSVNNGLLVEVDNMDLCKANTEDDSNNLQYNQHVTSEICHQEEVEDSQNEHVEAISIGYQLMDESSRMGYKRLTKYVEKPKPLLVTDLTQTSWNKLRSCRADLAEYVRSEKQYGLQIVNLTHEMSNLLSETDILLSHGPVLTDDSVESSFLPSEPEESYSLYDKRLFASTAAEHGFCYYAKSFADIGSTIGSVSTVDLASEMVASATGSMSSSNIAKQDIGTGSSLFSGRNSESSMPISDRSSKSENKSSLFDVLQSIVPSKSYTTLKGPAFYEYLSSLRSISRSETSRLLSQSNENTRKRRRRADKHYLSTGALMLSPEEIALLGRIDSCNDNSSQRDESI